MQPTERVNQLPDSHTKVYRDLITEQITLLQRLANNAWFDKNSAKELYNRSDVIKSIACDMDDEINNAANEPSPPPIVGIYSGNHIFCGGCNGLPGKPCLGLDGSRIAQLFYCQGCGGIIGEINSSDWPKVVRPDWAKEDVPADQLRYIDIDRWTAGKMTRFHGFINPDRQIVQVG